MLGIGLPAGAEFGLMAVYLLIVYMISRPFGAAAQAGFGIGLRIVQALFMPVVALGFAVAPVAGQNFGAGKGTRVRQTFRDGALMASGGDARLRRDLQLIPGDAHRHLLARPASDRGRIGVPAHHVVELRRLRAHLRRLEHVPGDGQHLPALATSTLRIVLVAIPAFILSGSPGFELHWVWYLSVATTWCR